MDKPEDDRNRVMAELMAKIRGTFPDGKLNPDDEGATVLAVHTEKGLVRIDFPAPVTWIALPPAEAVKFAQMLIDSARELGASVSILIGGARGGGK